MRFSIYGKYICGLMIQETHFLVTLHEALNHTSEHASHQNVSCNAVRQLLCCISAGTLLTVWRCLLSPSFAKAGWSSIVCSYTGTLLV